MVQVLYIATIYYIMNNLIYVNEPISLYTLREVKDLIINTFPGEKTYLTKECDSKESIISMFL